MNHSFAIPSSRRPRRMITWATVVLAAAVVVSACGGASDGTEADQSSDTTAAESTTMLEPPAESTTSTEPASEDTTTTAAVSEPVDAPTIEILDQGGDERVELRYTIADQVYRARLSQIQTLRQTIDGQLTSEVLDLETLFEIELTSRVVPEGYEFSAEYTDVSLGEDTDPALAAPMMAQLDQLVGSVFLTTIDDRGYVIAQAFIPPAAAPDGTTLEELMESIAGQNQFANPLPTEAMGVGGSWMQTQSLTLNGISMVQETIYTITSIDGTVVSMDVSGVQLVEAGPIDFPGLADTVEVSVESWDVTTSGTIVADLTRPFPSSTAAVEGLQVLVGTGSEEFRLEQGLNNVATITPVD